MTSIVRFLTAQASAPCITSLAELAARAEADGAARFPSSVDRAAALGSLADRLGYAFAAGYGVALERLVPSLGSRVASLCATERGGGHPRSIETRLAPIDGGAFTLTGTKAWVTLGAEASWLLVVASVGLDAEGKNRLRVAMVPADRAGVTLVARPAAPFAPEIAHAEVRFEAVAVAPSEVLPGDGYDAYLKPLRTLEDLHVVAAAVGYLVGVARAHAWPRAWTEEALATLVALRALGAEDASSAEVHLVLAGALEGFRRLVASADPHWSRVADGVRERWMRDRAILDVAGGARQKRSDAAWRRIAGELPAGVVKSSV